MKIVTVLAALGLAGVTSVLALTTGATQAAPLPPAGSADVLTTTFANGSRSIAISASDGRFAERRYGKSGVLQHELIVDDSTLTEYTPSSGTAVYPPRNHGPAADDRIDMWEPEYRSEIEAGYLRLIGADTLDGRRVHVLAPGSPPTGKMVTGPTSSNYRLYVDAVTWAPIRSVVGTTVVFTATDEIVPLASVENQLAPTHPTADASRAKRKTSHHAGRKTRRLARPHRAPSATALDRRTSEPLGQLGR